jgi:glycosyltransferase involved in cell wall biosynthesis
MDGLAQLMALPQSQLQNMGSRALTFVRERYDWQIICSQLEAVYGWMRGVSRAPDCLYFK